MHTDVIVADNCSCPCQEARFSVNGRSLARFICHCRICQTLYQAPFVRLAFVPTRNLKGATNLPAPTIHIFYHRRVADVQDPLPKVSGYWRSELAVSRLVLSGIARGGA